jgi:transketolase
MAEGSIWEAFQHAGWAGLDNLTAIVDVNRLGQTRETMLGWDLDTYAARAESFGWKAIPVDGHDLDLVDAAFAQAVSVTDRPTVIFARTHKGRGVRAVEDQPGQHGKPLEEPSEAIAELGGERSVSLTVRTPTPGTAHRFATVGGALPRWEIGDEVATRQAYGQSLAELGGLRGDVVVLDGEVSNSTMSSLFAEAHPERYFEMFIAEQQMIAAAVGMQVRGWVPFASTFGAFMTRAHDFIRMAAVSRADLRLCGSHAGVSIGEDGPSQMALEDISMFRSIHGSTVLHPSDANQTAALVAEMATLPGISYLRTLRGKTLVRTSPDENIRVGGSRVLRNSDDDDLTIVACGITVGEAVKAAEVLDADGIRARVIDCYSLKPIDGDTLALAAAQTRAVLTVEDHWPEGGLGDAVLDALAACPDRPVVRKLAVSGMPVSGKPGELLHAAHIDAEAVVEAARQLVQA